MVVCKCINILNGLKHMAVLSEQASTGTIAISTFCFFGKLSMADRYNLPCTPLNTLSHLSLVFRRCKLNVCWTNPPLEVDWKQIGTKFIVYSSNNNKLTHSAPPSTATLSKLSRLGHIHVLYMLYLPSKIWTTMAYHAGLLLTRYCRKRDRLPSGLV